MILVGDMTITQFVHELSRLVLLCAACWLFLVTRARAYPPRFALISGLLTFLYGLLITLGYSPELAAILNMTFACLLGATARHFHQYGEKS